LKILCTAKRVPDPEIKLRVAKDGAGFVTDGAHWIVNPFDHIAVEEGLRIKEKHGGEVVILSVGPADCGPIIRQCLAMGADRGILVKTDTADPDAVARVTAKLCAEEKPDLVLMGKQAVDYDMSQTASLLAELMGWPQASYAYKVEVLEGGKAVRVVCEVDGGLETVELELPAVITADLRLNEPRFAKLPNIMKAKTKPLRETSFAELGVDPAPKVRSLKLGEPPARKAGEIVKDVATLVQKLHEQAKAI